MESDIAKLVLTDKSTDGYNLNFEVNIIPKNSGERVMNIDFEFTDASGKITVVTKKVKIIVDDDMNVEYSLNSFLERFKMKRKILIIVVVLLVLYLIFRIIPFGFTKKSFTYDLSDGKQTVILGVPRLSFLGRENDRSYSYKNVRGNNVLKKEVKDF